MPIRVEITGTNQVVEFPDGTPPAQIEAILRSQIGQQQEQEYDPNQDIGALEAGLIAAGRGMTTIGRGLGFIAPEDPAVTKRFGQLEQRYPISTTIGEISGQAAPFVVPGVGVAGIAGQGARLAATFGLGALEGGAITRGEGGDLSETITGAGIGGVAAGAAELLIPRIARAGGKIIRRALGRDPSGAVIDSSGRPSAEFLEALERSGLSIDDIAEQERLALAGEAVEPAEAARASFLRSQGIEPTRAQVTRTAADFQAQQEAAKTSNRVRNALERQEAHLTSRFDNAVLRTGGDADTPTNTVIDAVTSKATNLDQKISSLYSEAKKAAPGTKNIRLSLLDEALRKSASADNATKGALSAIAGELRNKGVLSKKNRLIGSISAESAEDVRKFINSLYDPNEPFRNIKLRELKDALDDDVFSAAGDDFFQQARKAKADFERELSRAKISKFDSRRQNLVRDVLENKVDPDQLIDKVVFGKSWRADDLKQLRDYITTDDIGQRAFNDLRAETISKIKNMAFIGPEDAEGFKSLSRSGLQKALSKIGKQKMDVIFTSSEQRFFDDMLKVAKLREPVRGTALGQGPSAQAVNRLRAEIRQRSLIANLIDSVSFDKEGRAALKATPAKVVGGITRQQRLGAQALGQGAAIGAVSQVEQQ